MIRMMRMIRKSRMMMRRRRRMSRMRMRMHGGELQTNGMAGLG